MALLDKKCVPCEGGTEKLDPKDIARLLRETPGWTAAEDKLKRTYHFPSFVVAMKFVGQMAELAEQEGHHPDFCVHYSRVDVTLYTHAIGGLSENDFILAAKIEHLLPLGHKESSATQ